MADKKMTAKLTLGYTINLGGYESARIDVGAEVEGDKENSEQVWKEVKEEVEQQLKDEMNELKELYDEKETMLGLPKGPTFK